ncbi:hypothetical protein NDN08_000435 [Rhodosorus marinus]|uniref:Uncharacterized protein n=1 Tax=Rhodosorus marinus TaxID=101924 RepID=A0AAV8UMX7_9RHOD|nr:hypothetical protein NDN08_000435 [Rhodosorus marinus]
MKEGCGFVGSGVAGLANGSRRKGVSSYRRLRRSSFVSSWGTESSEESPVNRCRSRTTPTAVFLWLRSPDENGDHDDRDDSQNDADDFGRPRDEEDMDLNSYGKGASDQGQLPISGRYNSFGFPRKSATTFSKSLSIYNELKDASPENIESLRMSVSSEAFLVFQRTAQGMVGSLPAKTFEIRVGTDVSGMEQLLYSSMVTGYVVRNAEFRMKMNEKVREGAAQVFTSVNPDGDSKEDDDLGSVDYMRGVPDKHKLIREELNGRVSWFDERQNKRIDIDGEEYIDRLEKKLSQMQEKIRPQVSGDVTNKLLLYLTRLPHRTVSSFGAEISEPATVAMCRILSDRLGLLNPSKMKMGFSVSREHVSQYICWCLLVGYSIRNLEMREDISELTSSYRRGMHMRQNTSPPEKEDDK